MKRGLIECARGAIANLSPHTGHALQDDPALPRRQSTLRRANGSRVIRTLPTRKRSKHWHAPSITPCPLDQSPQGGEPPPGSSADLHPLRLPIARNNHRLHGNRRPAARPSRQQRLKRPPPPADMPAERRSRTALSCTAAGSHKGGRSSAAEQGRPGRAPGVPAGGGGCRGR